MKKKKTNQKSAKQQKSINKLVLILAATIAVVFWGGLSWIGELADSSSSSTETNELSGSDLAVLGVVALVILATPVIAAVIVAVVINKKKR